MVGWRMRCSMGSRHRVGFRRVNQTIARRASAACWNKLMVLNTSKPRVLMIAYACDPNGGGEHLLGWGWAEAASKKFQVDLITTPKARAAVESRCLETGI